MTVVCSLSLLHHGAYHGPQPGTGPRGPRGATPHGRPGLIQLLASQYFELGLLPDGLTTGDDGSWIELVYCSLLCPQERRTVAESDVLVREIPSLV
jgi:hypothetical protein